MEDEHTPATKADLAELQAQLRAEIKEGSEQTRAEFHHEFDDLKELIRDSQTEILKAFYGYAQTTDAKPSRT